jgi:hypothetical protein
MNRFFRYVCSLFLILGLTSGAFAISDNAGTSSGDFLRLPAGARPAGMGEAFSAVADGPYSLYFNMGGLASVKQQEILVAHTMYYLDVNHEYLAYVCPFKAGGLGASFTYLGTTFEKRTAANDTEIPDSNGNVGEMALSVGYGQELLWGINGGLGLKYISSSLDGNTATSIAADLGFQKEIKENIKVGLAITNLAGSLKYITDAVSVENTLDLGISEKDYLLKNLLVALDYKTLLNMSGQTVNLGAEYIWTINNEWAFGPRAGYISQGAAITAGLGFMYKDYELDYAFNSQADLGLTNRVSLGIKF